MQRVSLEPAFVLHSRAYRSTSLIVDFFTKDYGRITAVAKSARGPKSRYRGLLQPFTPILIDFVGDGELKTLGAIELQNPSYRFQAKSLFCAYYLNELLLRLLAKDDAHPYLFQAYADVLPELFSFEHVQQYLRQFEWRLLEELGFMVSFQKDAKGDLIDESRTYSLDVQSGFVLSALPEQLTAGVFLGNDLKNILINQNALRSQQALKYIMRQLLQAHLGAKPVFSRKLIQDLV